MGHADGELRLNDVLAAAGRRENNRLADVVQHEKSNFDVFRLTDGNSCHQTYEPRTPATTAYCGIFMLGRCALRAPSAFCFRRRLRQNRRFRLRLN